MNFQQQEEFYQVMTRLKTNSSSRAASTKDDARVTEMINGLLVSKPATSTTKKKSEPEITILNDSWDREQESKAASVPGINKIKAIHDFINSNGRRF
jgi:predicted protein tyrosine phosphatase